LSINIDKNIIPESIDLEKVVNDFNRSRLGVKLVINTTSENDTVLTFSVEIISSGIKEAFDKDSVVNFIEILASTPSNVLESLNQARG
jgi:Mg2+/Co2+ transporter CorC